MMSHLNPQDIFFPLYVLANHSLAHVYFCYCQTLGTLKISLGPPLLFLGDHLCWYP